VSENIRVVSIVGRFLEHSRIYWFDNGGEPEVYLGSADLMPRNLNRRVEIVFPVMDASIEERLRTEVLETYWNDNVQARVMQPDGTYVRRTPAEDEEPLDAQQWFLAYHKKKAAARRRGNR
jgi:polyphosphate kinase